MFEERYNKDQPAVRKMAERMASDSPQNFPSLDDFAGIYGEEAIAMMARGGLLAALWDIGIDAVPVSIEGSTPKGLKWKRNSDNA